jgi:hypothetical protein
VLTVTWTRCDEELGKRKHARAPISKLTRSISVMRVTTKWLPRSLADLDEAALARRTPAACGTLGVMNR